MKDKLFTNRVAFSFGAYSHISKTMFQNKPCVSVSYLRYQGAEFLIQFETTTKCNVILKSLFDEFHKGEKPYKHVGHGYNELQYHTEVNNCISPLGLLKLCQEVDPSAKLLFTPTTWQMRLFFFGDNATKVVNEHLEWISESNSYTVYNDDIEQLLAA